MTGRSDAGGKPGEDPIVAFFDGSGTDRDGRTFEDLLDLDHVEFESDHRHIQWLFPTPEKSSFGYFTPRISPAEIHAFRSRPELRDRLRRALRHALDFLGLQLIEGEVLAVVEGPFFSHRAAAWITEGNHNYLRISRILRSLTCLGLEAEAQAFLAYLEDLYLRRGDVIGPRALAYWRRRAEGDGGEIPVGTFLPET